MTMPKSRNGPRSVFSLLPLSARLRMTALIQDGATCEAIGKDSEIAEAYAVRGAALTRSSLTRIRQSKEYTTLAAMRQKKLAAVANDQLSAALLREVGEGADVGEQVKVSLLRILSELSDLSEMSDITEKIKAARSLAQTLGALGSATKDNRIAELTRKIDRKDAEISELKSEMTRAASLYAAENQQLKNELNHLKTKLSEFGISQIGSVADEMDKLVGL